MKNSMSWRWTVSGGGGIPPKVAQQIVAMLANMRGKHIKLTLEEKSTAAYDPQKRYYRGVVLKYIHQYMHAQGTHVTVDDTHEYLRRLAGLEEMDEDTGEVRAISTSAMTTKQMSHLIETALGFAAQGGIPIPEPTENLEKYKDYLRE